MSMATKELNTVFTWFKYARILIRSAIEVEKKTFLQELLSLDDSNRQCADCSMNGPQYANLFFLVFVCGGCSKVHLSFPQKEFARIVNVREDLPKDNLPNEVNFFFKFFFFFQFFYLQIFLF